jgi:hypothetical protein
MVRRRTPGMSSPVCSILSWFRGRRCLGEVGWPFAPPAPARGTAVGTVVAFVGGVVVHPAVRTAKTMKHSNNRMSTLFILRTDEEGSGRGDMLSPADRSNIRRSDTIRFPDSPFTQRADTRIQQLHIGVICMPPFSRIREKPMGRNRSAGPSGRDHARSFIERNDTRFFHHLRSSRTYAATMGYNRAISSVPPACHVNGVRLKLSRCRADRHGCRCSGFPHA